MTPTDAPPAGMFQAIFAALHADTVAAIGPIDHRLLVIPLDDAARVTIGGLWGCTMLSWLSIEMLYVPPSQRRQGTATALVRAAEAEALRRGCRHALVDTFSAEAAGFYERLGFIRFGTLNQFPPGQQRIYYRKDLPDGVRCR